MTAQEQGFSTRTFAELRGMELFDGLSDARLRVLLSSSDEVDFVAGDVLWTEREPAVIWWVLLEGQLEMVRHVGRERVVFGSFTRAGQWGEGWAAFDPDGVYLVSGHATTDGRILRVPVASLRALAEDVPVIRHVLDGLFHTAREIETMTRQREALVALGTLAAGLAHELNNPAAAAVRAATSLEDAMRESRSAVRALTERGLSSAQLSALDALLEEARESTNATDALAAADREEDLAGWMTRHHVERDWMLAPTLAAAGFGPEWCDRVLAASGEATLQPALEWLAASRASMALLAEVKVSIDRVSSLVHSAKSYSQMDRGSFQRLDVREGLDSTLTVLAHVLGSGVVVEREYAADVPEIDGYPGELNQVWTSLISNAVDAMRGQGVLALSLSTAGDRVIVTVTDSGVGMPPEVLDRAFDPFFTTKDVGKGSGLGLALARRVIVERHGGDISIESEPGHTLVRVALPRQHSA